MPSFLRELRRKKSAPKISEAAEYQSPVVESTSEGSNDSSTTVDTTPPSTVPPSETSFGGKRQVSVRPAPTKRYSLASYASQTSLSPSTSAAPRGQHQQPTSPFSPRVLSVSDNSWVHQKVLLIYGQIAEPAAQPMDGQISICHHQDSFPATSWPVHDSHFKALVHLQPGPNRLRLDFTTPKVPSSQTHSSWININLLPLAASPPLDLVLLLARDSTGSYDAVPERAQREGNGLDVAIRKYKMAAHLWQAFTGEQMNRNSFGRRCFRFDEEWQPGSLSCRDVENAVMRNEARVHVVRMSQTVAEIHQLDRGSLFQLAAETVKDYFSVRPGQMRYVSAMMLDSHWDPEAGRVRAQIAAVGGDDSIKLSLFGSHALQSYPSCIEEVVPAFSDCTRTDTAFVANDSHEMGSNWEAANMGIGGHLKQIGHLFGCNDQETGVMGHDYIKLNRTFTCREPYSTRTKSPGQRLCLPRDECCWHRLDCLRFRRHPCFALPSDMAANQDNSVHLWRTESGNGLATASTGIAFVEIYPQGCDFAAAHIEYLDNNFSSGLPRQVSLSESDLRSRLPKQHAKKALRVEIRSGGGGLYAIKNFGTEMSAKEGKVKLPNGKAAFRSSSLGDSGLDGTQPQQVLLQNVSGKSVLKQVRVYHAMALLGIEFVYEDNSTQMFGQRGGTCGSFDMDIWRGEIISGFYVRSSACIDALQIWTSTGRKSAMFGHATGGVGSTLVPPRSYTIAGIAGTCANRVDGFSVIITR